MKSFKSVFWFLLACSCSGPIETVPNTYLVKSSAKVSVKNDIVFVGAQPYNGFLVELSPTRDTLALEGYYKGKLSGLCKKWYPNRQLQEERNYLNGQKHGKQVSYWENGHKRFEFVALNDAYEGELKEWSRNGKLYHLATYVNGQEEGPQKMWYDNCKIRANYVILKGKRYGLLGTKNCKNVSDSIFVVK